MFHPPQKDTKDRETGHDKKLRRPGEGYLGFSPLLRRYERVDCDTALIMLEEYSARWIGEIPYERGVASGYVLLYVSVKNGDEFSSCVYDMHSFNNETYTVFIVLSSPS
jgi:hypothetical protein